MVSAIGWAQGKGLRRSEKVWTKWHIAPLVALIKLHPPPTYSLPVWSPPMMRGAVWLYDWLKPTDISNNDASCSWRSTCFFLEPGFKETQSAMWRGDSDGLCNLPAGPAKHSWCRILPKSFTSSIIVSWAHTGKTALPGGNFFPFPLKLPDLKLYGQKIKRSIPQTSLCCITLPQVAAGLPAKQCWRHWTTEKICLASKKKERELLYFSWHNDSSKRKI